MEWVKIILFISVFLSIPTVIVWMDRKPSKPNLLTPLMHGSAWWLERKSVKVGKKYGTH